MFKGQSIFFEENTTEENWAALKTNIINGLKRLKADSVIVDGDTISFKGAQYTARNFLVYISSGEILFDSQKKTMTYNVSFFLKLVPAFSLLIASIVLLIFFSIFRNGFFIFFCFGTVFLIFFADWWIRNQFSQFINKCIRQTATLRVMTSLN